VIDAPDCFGSRHQLDSSFFALTQATYATCIIILAQETKYFMIILSKKGSLDNQGTYTNKTMKNAYTTVC